MVPADGTLKATDSGDTKKIQPMMLMDILFSPILGTLIWVGGGTAGLVLLIVVIVLLVR